MSEFRDVSPELRARLALERCGFHHTHSLGQNFILDERLLGRLLDDCAVAPDDNVLEIGPGAGVMTRLIAMRAKAVLAVEIDRGLEPVLDEMLGDLDNARVLYRDFMKADVARVAGEAFGGEPYRVIANLPYYITADILLRLVNCERPPESICIMVQREAAERIMSEPGSKQWCALAANLRFYGAASVLEEVPADAFDPPPHVTSCFIRIDRQASPEVAPKDRALFLRVVNAAFAMRRKTLANNLKAAFGLDQGAAADVLERAGLDVRVRGEVLTLSELCRVADLLAESEG